MIQSKKQTILREVGTLLLVLAVIAVSEYVFFQLWRLDW